VRIRAAAAGDREFILRLAARLTEFGDVPGRDRGAMMARDRDVLATALDGGDPRAAVFVAADDEDRRLGFIHLTVAEDYYSNRETAHVADLVVAVDAAGRGVGSALLAHAEQWGKAHGFAMLTLNVFSANRAAREFYARRGFSEEWIRCVRRLSPD
jgi:GNAT superfamily N-acetyltransferase